MTYKKTPSIKSQLDKALLAEAKRQGVVIEESQESKVPWYDAQEYEVNRKHREALEKEWAQNHRPSKNMMEYPHSPVEAFMQPSPTEEESIANEKKFHEDLERKLMFHGSKETVKEFQKLMPPKCNRCNDTGYDSYPNHSTSYPVCPACQ